MSAAADSESYLSRLQERLRRSARTANYSLLLEAGALHEAEGLRDQLLRGDNDLEILHTLGQFHWQRSELACEGRDDDRHAAVRYLTPCFVDGSFPIPAGLAANLADAALPEATRRLSAARGSADVPQISAAVELWRRLVTATPQNHDDYAARLSDLSVLLTERYERTGRPGDLDEAISIDRALVERYPGSGKYLINLSIDLRSRYERSAQPRDIDEAVDAATRALDATSVNHPQRQSRLRHLDRARELSRRRPSRPRSEDGPRSRLLRAVNARTARHMGLAYDFRAHLAGFGGQDPEAVISDEASAEALALCAISSDLAADDEVLDAAGWLFWVRATARGTVEDGRGKLELALAVNLFCLLWFRQPDMVPNEVRALMTRAQSSSRENQDDGLDAADSLRSWYKETGDENALLSAVRLGRQRASQLRGRSPLELWALEFLALTLPDLYGIHRDEDVLDEAIRVTRQIINEVPSDSRDHELYSRRLAGLRRTRQQPSPGSPGAASRPLEAGEQERAQRIVQLMDRMNETGDREDLRAAVSALREFTGADAAERASHYLGGTFALILITWVEQTRDLTALDEALAVLRLIAAGEPGDDDLLLLGKALGMRADSTDDPEAVSEGIAILRRAAAGSARSKALPLLGYMLGRQYEASSALQIPDETLAVLREAAGADGERFTALANLGNALSVMANRTGDPQTFDEAAAVLREAFQAAPPSGPDRVTAAVSLTWLLDRRFALTGDLADLSDGIALTRESLRRARPGHPDRAWWLATFSFALQHLHERTGDEDAIAEAVAAAREAVDISSPHQPTTPYALHALGRALMGWSDQSGDTAALEMSAETMRQAIRLRPADDPESAEPLSTLGMALLRLHRKHGQPQVLDEAVTALRRAADVSPDAYANKAMHLSNLGMALALAADSADSADYEEVIRLHQQAVDITPDGHPSKPTYLNNLAGALLDHALGQDALDILRRAGSEAPPGHPLRVLYLKNLGATLARRGEWGQAASAFREAAQTASAAPAQRVDAGRQWAQAAVLSDDIPQALTAFSSTLALLPQLAPRYLGRAEAQLSLEQLAGLARDAAEVAFRTGAADRALPMLEMGRGVLLAQALETRGDLQAVHDRVPALAREYDRLRDAVNEVTGPLAGESALASWRAGEQRRQLDRELHQLLEQIRSTPGLASFQRFPPEHELRNQAQAGPVAVINVSALGTHAILVTPDAIDSVPLPGVTLEDATQRAEQFLAAAASSGDPDSSLSERLQAQQLMLGTLKWLWHEIAGPVLDRLQLTAAPQPGQKWPRMWWCPTGPLGVFPLHAAGDYHEAGGPAVLDRVISSYTPTVTALAHARRRFRSHSHAKTLIIGAPDDAGLPGAEREVEKLTELIPRATVLAGASATVSDVLAALPGYSQAHFACHGLTNFDSPSDSALVLSGSEGGLTVGQVSELDLSQAELAFLSACDTTRTSSRLIDEAIHLTSGFLLAGYPHVIGTLWAVDDSHSADLAADFYEHLSQGHAEALHNAVRRARDRHRNSPSLWAAHIHVGP